MKNAQVRLNPWLLLAAGATSWFAIWAVYSYVVNS
jgi:hypothetical protein